MTFFEKLKISKNERPFINSILNMLIEINILLGRFSHLDDDLLDIK